MPGTVTVRPIQAKLETATGTGSTIQRLDPYCVAIVGNHHVEGKVCKKGGLTPHWEDSISLSRNQEPYCYLEVKDKSLLKDKMLGVCAIDLEMLPGQETQQKWYDLYYQQKPVGEILVETVYTPEGSQAGRSAEKMFIKEDYMASDSLRGSSTGMMTMTTPTNRNFGSLQGIYDEPASDFNSRRSYDQGRVNYSYESGSVLERTPESIMPLRTNMSNLQSELRDMSKRVDEMLSKAKGMDYGTGRDYSSGSIVIQSTQLVPGMLENATIEEGVHRMPNDSGINASHQEFIEERTSHHSSKREKLVDKAKELKQKIVTGMDHIKELAHEKKEELLHRRDDEVEYGGSPERKRGGGGMKVKFFEGVEKFAHSSVKKLEGIEEKAREKKEAERREWEEARHDPGKLEIFKEKLVEEIVQKLGGHHHKRKADMVDEAVQTEISFGFEENVTMKSFNKGGKKNKLTEKVKEFKEKIEEGVENIKESIEEKKGHGKKHHHHQHGESHSHSQSHSHSHGKKKKKNEDGKLHEGMEKLKAVAEAILSQLHHPQESGSEAEAEESYSSSSSSEEETKKKKKEKEKKKSKKNQKKTGLVKDIIVEGAKEGMKEKAKDRAKEKVEDIKEKVIGESEGADDEKVEYDVEVEQVEAEHKKKRSATTTAGGHGIKEKIEEGVEIVKDKLGMNKIQEEKIIREEQVIMNEEENEKLIEQYIEHDEPHTLKEKVMHGIERVEEMLGLVHKEKKEEIFTVEEAGENQAYNVDWFKKKALIEEPQQDKLLVEEAVPMIDSSKVFAADHFTNIEADGVEKVKEFYMIPNDESTEKIVEESHHEKEKESLLETIKEKVHEGVEKVKETLHLGSAEKHQEKLLSSSSPFRSSGGYQMMSSPSVEHRQGRDIYHIPIPTSTRSSGFGGDMYDEMKRRYLASEMMEPSQTYTGNVLTDSLMEPAPLFTEALNELTGVHSDLAAMQQNQAVLEDQQPREMVITEEIYEVPLGPQDSKGEMPVMEVQEITVEEMGQRNELAGELVSDLIEMVQNQAGLEGQQPVEMVVTEEIYEVPLGPQDSKGEMPVMEVQEITVEEVAPGQGFVVDLDKEQGGVGIVQEQPEGFVLVEEVVEEVVLIEKEGEGGNQANLLEVLENRGIEKDNEAEKRSNLKEEHVEIHEENIENEDPNRFKKIFDRVAE